MALNTVLFSHTGINVIDINMIVPLLFSFGVKVILAAVVIGDGSETVFFLPQFQVALSHSHSFEWEEYFTSTAIVPVLEEMSFSAHHGSQS